MNKKKTNFLVAILNLTEIVSILVLHFGTSYLLSGMMSSENVMTSIYNSFISETLLNKIDMILILIHSVVGVINIICAIQNKKNKKLFFWQMVFGIYELYTAFLLCDLSKSLCNILDDYDVLETSKKIISIIPIIFVIINFIRIRKNKPKTIQIISYIGVIVLVGLDLLGIFGAFWNVIAVIMQLIYIHFQDKKIEETKKRKIVNIILYYIIQSFFVIGFFFMILYSLFITKVNEIKWENGLKEVFNGITKLQGNTNKEIYIPVEKDNKYGFITEDGKEKIPCQYDNVSFFYEIEINGVKYYISLVKLDNIFYIISKDNDSIKIEGNLDRYYKKIYTSHMEPFMDKAFKDVKEYKVGNITSFQFLLQVFTRGEKRFIQNTLESNDDLVTKVLLNVENSKYTYTSDNYTMIIEQIKETVKDDVLDNYYDTDYTSSVESKFKVTIRKNNGDEKTEIVYLPGINLDELWLKTFTNGYIEFETEDKINLGWYDNNGNQIIIPNNYKIIDIKDNKVFLRVMDNNEEEKNREDKKYEPVFIILNMEGKIQFKTTALDIYNEIYLVKKNNKKMVLIDRNLKEISNEYDKIITTIQVDVRDNYCSYY